jgi:hypothetical protein
MKNVNISVTEQVSDLDKYFALQYDIPDGAKWSWGACVAFITLLSLAGWFGVVLLVS